LDPLRNSPSALFRIFALAAVALPLAAVTPQEALKADLEARFLGDRTGACVAAALVGETTVEAFVCADALKTSPLDRHTTFELGNVAKTMASAILEDLVQKGEVSLDDPLAKFLPKGAKVPDFESRPITLGQLAAHRSGLPSLPGRLKPGDGTNPYAALTQEDLLGSLADVKLVAFPGSQYRYSHFGMMLLSLALARHTGLDFQTLLTQRIFKPLGMDDAHLASTGAAGREAQGHASSGRPVGAWDFPVDLAGAGGVRASLADLVRYVEGQLGLRPSAVNGALLATQAAPPMNWMTLNLGGRAFLFQEGATGGFTAFVGLDPTRRKGVVLLADTALANLGGLAPLGLSLLDPGFPPAGYPRRPMPAGSLLLDGMTGIYALKDGPQVVLDRKGDRLTAQIAGQPPVALAYDSSGDFYGLETDLLPVRTGDGYAFVLGQGGGTVKAERIQGLGGGKAAADLAALKTLEGEYRVTPEFSVTVTVKKGILVVQGTGQPETPVESVKEDVFMSRSAGVVFSFTRDRAGHVDGVTIKQGGRSLKGDKL